MNRPLFSKWFSIHDSFLISSMVAIYSELLAAPMNKSQINHIYKINVFFTSMRETEKADASVEKKNCFLEVRDSNLNDIRQYTDKNIGHEYYRLDSVMRTMMRH
jgi:hypothetical protein